MGTTKGVWGLLLNGRAATQGEVTRFENAFNLATIRQVTKVGELQSKSEKRCSWVMHVTLT